MKMAQVGPTDHRVAPCSCAVPAWTQQQHGHGMQGFPRCTRSDRSTDLQPKICNHLANIFQVRPALQLAGLGPVCLSNCCARGMRSIYRHAAAPADACTRRTAAATCSACHR